MKPVLLCSSAEGNTSGAQENRDGRVVELVDSLDSGSSVHCGRAGSSPASPTKTGSSVRVSLFFLIHTKALNQFRVAHHDKIEMKSILLCRRYI